jgi:hypothetical protein
MCVVETSVYSLWDSKFVLWPVQTRVELYSSGDSGA